MSETLELRRKIAEIEGLPVYTREELVQALEKENWPQFYVSYESIKNGGYAPDLDLNHVARIREKVLTTEEIRSRFKQELAPLLFDADNPFEDEELAFLGASARSQCEALIRAMEAESAPRDYEAEARTMRVGDAVETPNGTGRIINKHVHCDSGGNGETNTTIQVRLDATARFQWFYCSQVSLRAGHKYE